MLLKGKYLYNGDDLSSAYYIREQVFQIEQNIPKELEMDDKDNQSIHAVIFTDERAVATGRLYYDGNSYYLEKVAVLCDERQKKYGDFVVRMLVDKAFLIGAKEVYVNAPNKLVLFYKKIGFIPYEEIVDKCERKELSHSLFGHNRRRVCDMHESKSEIEFQKMKLLYGGLCKACKSH